MKLNSRHSVDCAGLAVVCGLTALVYFAGIAPVLARAEARSTQQEELNVQEREVARKAQDVREGHLRLAGLEAEQAKAVRLYPATLRNDRVRRISELAVESGITMTDLTPREAVRGDRVGRVPISLSGSGSAPAFRSFLRRLHEEFADTQVLCFSMTGTPESADQLVAVSAELVWFTLGDGAARPGGAGRAAGAGAGAAGNTKAP